MEFCFPSLFLTRDFDQGRPNLIVSQTGNYIPSGKRFWEKGKSSFAIFEYYKYRSVFS